MVTMILISIFLIYQDYLPVLVITDLPYYLLVITDITYKSSNYTSFTVNQKILGLKYRKMNCLRGGNDTASNLVLEHPSTCRYENLNFL